MQLKDGDTVSMICTAESADNEREPAPLEKLEALCRRIIDGNDEKLNAELDACIAAVKGAK